MSQTASQTVQEIMKQAVPGIRDEYKRVVRWQFDSLVQTFGGPELKGIYNRKEIFRLRAIQDGLRSSIVNNQQVWAVDEDRLEQAASDHAERTVLEWASKVTRKMGELDGATVDRMDGGGFLIRGTVRGLPVRIEQARILNTSTRGILFNQYPARIYVDGKAISEKKFQETHLNTPKA